MNKEGRYTADAGKNFVGLEVLTEGTDAVIKFMGDNILHTENFEHSYPYDWRTKKPVLTIASHQWFVDTNSLKDKAIVNKFNSSTTKKPTEIMNSWIFFGYRRVWKM